VPPIDLTLRDMTALGELDEFVEPISSPRANGDDAAATSSTNSISSSRSCRRRCRAPPVAARLERAPPLPLPPASDDVEPFHQFACEFRRDPLGQHDEEAARGRRAAPRASLPAQRVRVRRRTPRSSAICGTRARRLTTCS
jgi:hypothetical protein